MKPARSFLEGAKTRLRAIKPDDMPDFHRWLNDNDVTYYMYYGQKPTTLEQATDMIMKQVCQENNVVLGIEDKKRKTLIGFCGLYDVHPTARKAEFRILIGERAFWNRGYGTEVAEILTFYAFDRLNLNRVWLGVTQENKGAAQSYKKAGYKMEGVLREDTYRNSTFYDTLRMGVLRSDYYPDFYQQQLKRNAALK